MDSTMIDNLKNEFHNAGLMVDSPILDGTIKRCGTTEKPKGKDGWYIGWSKLIGGKDCISCAIGDWAKSDNASITYKSWKDHHFSHADLTAIDEHQEQLKKKIAAEKAKRHKEAAKKANQDWLSLSETGSSGYLASKGVKAHGIRYGHDEKEGDYIAVPIRGHDGEIKGLQLIYDNPLSYDPTRNKTFSSGVEKKGNFHLIGTVSPIAPLCFAEGYATAASVHEATGYPVIVCFDAGNIKPVVEAWRKTNPQHNFIVCADNDQWKDKNTGIEAATDAAKAHGCFLAIPDFTGFDVGNKPTDFNDLHKLAGLEHLKAVLAEDLNSEHLKPVVKPTAATAQDPNDTTANNGDYPSIEQRPCYLVHEKGFLDGDNRKCKAGTYLHGSTTDKSTGDVYLVDTWICSPLHIKAVTLDQHNNNYGRYLHFQTMRGGWRYWCMPMAMLKGSGDELRGELLSQGININIDDKRFLPRYLNQFHPKETLEISTQTGWHKEAYILPDRCIGSDKYFYQSENFHTDIPYRQRGTLAEWQQHIARYCVGNPLLMLSVCAAFAGALLKPAHQKGGGFHFVGESSKGKTTGLEVACSVHGDETFKRSWKATGNGMEATATMFNDSLLALDEVSECDGKEVGAIIYQLGNGVGKSRANKNGGSRATYQWRVMVLSNGERSIESAMQEAGKQIKAGQELRLLNIPIFGNYGAFNALHDKQDGRELSDHLQTAAKKYHGVAGIEYLTKLVAETRNIDALATEYTEALINGESLSSQEHRAAKRFGLLALAGELATEYGITGWQPEQATAGVYECFKKWREAFGGGDLEERQVLQSVKDFIDRFGDGRFTDCVGGFDIKVNDRAGYWKNTDNGRTYLFNNHGLTEALTNYGLKRGAEILKKHGWLECGAGHLTKQQRINNGLERFYWVKTPD